MKNIFYSICLIFILVVFSSCSKKKPVQKPVQNLSLPWVQLNVKPSVETKTDSQIILMPKENELIDGNAVTLYQQAITSFPKDFNSANFSDWRKLPCDIDQLPVEEIEKELQKFKPTIELINKAVKCKQCNWSTITPGQMTQKDLDDMTVYRYISFILDVQAHLQIAQGQYDSAIETIKTNLKMANNLGDSTNLNQVLMGNAIGAISIIRIDNLIQNKNAPNFYHALKQLPLPIADANNAIKTEIDNLKNHNFLVRLQFRKSLETTHNNLRKQINHLTRKITALQIIEALRLYAGKHDGKFPEKLSDITDYEIPKDPVTGKQFDYESSGSEATLQIEGTEGSNGRDSVRYELKLRK